MSELLTWPCLLLHSPPPCGLNAALLPCCALLPGLLPGCHGHLQPAAAAAEPSSAKPWDVPRELWQQL